MQAQLATQVHMHIQAQGVLQQTPLYESLRLIQQQMGGLYAALPSAIAAAQLQAVQARSVLQRHWLSQQQAQLELQQHAMLQLYQHTPQRQQQQWQKQYNHHQMQYTHQQQLAHMHHLQVQAEQVRQNVQQSRQQAELERLAAHQQVEMAGLMPPLMQWNHALAAAPPGLYFIPEHLRLSQQQHPQPPTGL
jgi:hypothetical protein